MATKCSTYGSLLQSPQYTLHLKAVQTALEKDDKGQDTMITALADGLSDTATDKALRSEVENLNQTVKEIRASFNKINGRLVEFDDAKFTDTDGNVLVLQPGWAKLSRNFDALLAKSRTIASDAIGFLKSYSSTMLTDVQEGDIPDLKKDLKAFLEMLPRKQKEAEANRESFQELGKRVRTYKETISSAVRSADTALVESITEAEKKKDQLQDELDELDGEMQALLIAIGASALVAGGAAILAFVTVSPFAALIALGIALKAIKDAVDYAKKKSQYNATERELKKVERELAELYKKSEVLEKFKASIEATHEEMDNLACKLDTIANIWGSLASDLGQFETNIDLALQMGRRRAFIKQLEVARQLYDKLAEILDLYVKGAFLD